MVAREPVLVFLPRLRNELNLLRLISKPRTRCKNSNNKNNNYDKITKFRARVNSHLNSPSLFLAITLSPPVHFVASR